MFQVTQPEIVRFIRTRTEFAPARVLDAALECAAKEHLEVVTNRRSPNWFEANRETLN